MRLDRRLRSMSSAWVLTQTGVVLDTSGSFLLRLCLQPVARLLLAFWFVCHGWLVVVAVLMIHLVTLSVIFLYNWGLFFLF